MQAFSHLVVWSKIRYSLNRAFLNNLVLVNYLPRILSKHDSSKYYMFSTIQTLVKVELVIYVLAKCKSYNSVNIKLQVLFCSTEIGRTSFVRQLEPDWHIDTNPEISTQLAVKSFPCLLIYILIKLFS